MTCAKCGTSIMDVSDPDIEGYFVLNYVTADKDVDWNFCGSECLKEFVDEATDS